ncbi:MAG: formate--tetrahydrofolate ligase, partial [Candidatus Izemoplasmataceae bacterium]
VKKTELNDENVEALKQGIENLEKHIETIQAFNLPYVVAINHFVADTDAEVKALSSWLESNNHPYSISKVWEKGGEGATDLAEKVIAEIDHNTKKFTRMYEMEDSLETKIEKICKTVYGAKDVSYSKEAQTQLKKFKKEGWDKLQICMAKTQMSLSDDPKIYGRPKDFTITVRELRPSIGAGFIVALTGEMMTMPGLPKEPAAMQMDIDEEGNAKGLF